jgi:hypothetical protein
LPEDQHPVCSKAIRVEAAGTSLDTEIDDVIAAILAARFCGRTAAESCAIGGITASCLTLRQQHRCGALTTSQRASRRGPRSRRRIPKVGARGNRDTVPWVCFQTNTNDPLTLLVHHL